MTPKKTLPTNGIYIKDAIAWTKAWQKVNPNLPKAFSIPIGDLMELLQELGVLQNDGKGNLTTHGTTNPADGIRAYMATDLSTNEDKLILVGTVNVNGVAEDQVKGTTNTLKVSLAGEGAFDFVVPCPKKCDLKSPLY